MNGEGASESDSGGRSSLILLPGLGADRRVFEPQRAVFPDMVVIERIEPHERESLEGYATRLAGRFEDPARPYVLGGSSMGGMVALEMARSLRPAAVVLIGSASTGRAVRGWLQAVERASRPLPDWSIEVGRMLAPIGSPLFSSAGPVNRRLFLDMLADTPTGFLRWASRAIIGWDPESLPDVPIHRLHGSRDHIIRPPAPDHAEIVAGAGHLVNLSHPERTNSWLSGVLAGCSGS